MVTVSAEPQEIGTLLVAIRHLQIKHIETPLPSLNSG